MKIRWGLPMLLLLAIAVIATGCGSDDGDTGSSTGAAGTSEAKEEEPTNIAFLAYAYTDFTQAEEVGVKKVVEPGGGSVKVFNAGFDPQKQQKQCEDAVTSGRYNAILLAPVENAASVACAKVAENAGIPLAGIEGAIGPDTLKIEPQTPGVVESVVISSKTNAEGMVKQVKKACEGVDPCKVIAEVSTPSDDFTNAAAEAVDQEAGDNVEVVAKVVGKYDPTTIFKNLPDILRAHSDATVFMSAADTQALAALPAVKDAGLEGKLKLIGNGGSRLGAKAVADGTLFGTLGNWPEQQGKLAAEGLVTVVNGGTVENPGIDALSIDEPFDIDRSNVDQFVAEWGKE